MDIGLIRYARLEEAPNDVNGGFNRLFHGNFIDDSGRRVPGYLKELSWLQIIREVVAAILARILNIPVAAPYLVSCPDGLLSSLEDAPFDPSGAYRLLLGTRNCGQSLAHWIPQPSYRRAETSAAAVQLMEDHLAALRRMIEKWSAADKAVLFDEWIANSDRHQGNIMVGLRPDDLTLIDHEDAFGGRRQTFDQVKPGATSANTLLQWLWQSHAETICSPRVQNALKQFQTDSSGECWRAGLEQAARAMSNNGACFLPAQLAPFIDWRREYMTAMIGGKLASAGCPCDG